MTQKYLMPLLENITDGRRMKIQDLHGQVFTDRQRRAAMELADSQAAKLSQRSGEIWIGIVQEYVK